MSKAEGQRGMAKLELNYTAKLQEKQGVSKTEVELYQAKLDIAEAGLAEAKAGKAILEVQIQQAERRLKSLERAAAGGAGMSPPPTGPAAKKPEADARPPIPQVVLRDFHNNTELDRPPGGDGGGRSEA